MKNPGRLPNVLRVHRGREGGTSRRASEPSGSAGELHVSLLGPLQVWRGDARLDGALPGQLAREVLAMLLLERDRLVPAERLMDVFWPELEPAAAANNLQSVVVKLRRCLEPGLRRGRDSRYLVTEPEGYRFVGAGCRLDLNEFAQAAQAGQAALRAGDLEGARSALRQARDLYRGELLSDMPYAEWAFPARERLRETHLEALEALGHACLGLDVYDEALSVAQQARAIDPLREAFVRLEMRARSSLGERAEALAVCDEYERLLDDELRVEPSEETRALREEILTGTLPPIGPRVPAISAASVELPLVGRREVLESVERIRAEGGGVVLLSGEAGLGKTRVLEELAETMGHDVIGSQARPHDPPLAAVLRLFEEHLRRKPSAARLAELGPLGAPLAERVPALRLRWPDCPPYSALEGEAERRRLHEAALAALRLVATPPAVLVLDDLHWADEGSLAVLADVAWPSGVLVVGAFRGEEAEGPLADWLAARRASEHRPHEVELSPLSAEDVLAAVRGVVGVPDPLPLSRRLHEATAGHPLFLTEMLRGLLDAGVVYREADGSWYGPAEPEEPPLTATLREAVLARADRLDATEREVLDTAAVLRPRCSASLLEAVLQTDAERLASALQTLAARRWLVQAGTDRWEFGHQLTGEVVYAGLAAPHRRLVHRLAASALVETTPTEPGPAAAELVTHLVEGEGPAESLASWAVLAGRWAARQLSYQEALAHFELARAQLDRLADADERRRIGLSAYEGLGTVQPHVGQSVGALASLEHAHLFTADPSDRTRLLVAQARICARDTGEYDRAMELVAEAERLLAGSDEPVRLAEIHAIQADVHFWRGEHEAGVRLARLAVAGSRGTPAETDALRVLVNHLQKLGRQEEAVEANRRLLAMAEAAGDVQGAAVGYVALGNGLFALGRLADAWAALERVGEICERLGDVRRLSIKHTNSGMAAGAMGNLDPAEAELRRAIELAEQVGAPYTVAVARHHLGRVLTLRGRLKEARAQFEGAIAQAQAVDARVVEAQARLHYGLWHWTSGDAAATRAEAELTLAAGDSLGDNFCRRESRLLLGTLALEEGDLESAEKLAREGHAIAAGAQQVLAVGRAERLLGRVAAERGAFDDAEAHFAESEALFRRSGAPIELAQTLLDRAEALGTAAENDLREARRLLRRARALPSLKRAEQLLASR